MKSRKCRCRCCRIARALVTLDITSEKLRDRVLEDSARGLTEAAKIQLEFVDLLRKAAEEKP